MPINLLGNWLIVAIVAAEVTFIHHHDQQQHQHHLFSHTETCTCRDNSMCMCELDYKATNDADNNPVTYCSP